MKLCQESFSSGVGKSFFPQGFSQALKGALQGCGHKPDGVQETLGQCSQDHGVIFGVCIVQGQELDSVIFVSLFQLRIFYDLK